MSRGNSGWKEPLHLCNPNQLCSGPLSPIIIVHNTCCLIYTGPQPSASSQRVGLGWGSGNGNAGLPAASSPSWLGARGSGLPADGVHLSGCLGDGQEGKRACPHAQNLWAVTRSPWSSFQEGKRENMSFQALILSTWVGTMESQGPTAGTQTTRVPPAFCPRTPPLGPAGL